MGVEYPGEMDFYLWLAEPDVGTVLNVYPTHTEYLNNVQGVNEEKSKMITRLKGAGVAVLNKNNRYTRAMGKATKAKIVWFGDEGEISAVNSKLIQFSITQFTLISPRGKINVQLPLPGKQFVENALAASAIAYSLDFSLAIIKKGLERFEKPEHRMNLVKHPSGAIIVDDSYNNNPEAAISAVKTLIAMAGNNKKGVVMGDMLELGQCETKEHQRVGEYLGQSQLEFLIGVGKASEYLVAAARKKSANKKTYWAKDYQEAYLKLKKYLKPGFFILIKGSRSIGLDRLVNLITETVI